MPARKHGNDETSYQYTLRKQREKYQNDPENVAWSRIKYYKKKYKNNEDFNKILNSNNTYIEKLAKIKTFNNTTKFTKI